jgi:acyl carrier protein
MSNTTAERVIAVIAQTRKMPVESVRPEQTFQELGIDSLDGLSLLLALEEEFDISVPDEDGRTYSTVRQVIDGIELLVAAKAP